MRTALLTLAALAVFSPALAQKGGMKKAGPSVRMSTVMGASIESSDGQALGTAEDVILNDRNGRMQYVIGKMAEGGKLHALPFEKITLKTEGDETTLVVDAKAADLKNAEGFTADSYPDFTKADVRKGIDETFGIDRKAAAAQKNAKNGGKGGGKMNAEGRKLTRPTLKASGGAAIKVPEGGNGEKDGGKEDGGQNGQGGSDDE